MSRTFCFKTIAIFTVSVIFLFGAIFFGRTIINRALGAFMIYSYISDLSITPDPFDPSGDSDTPIDSSIWNTAPAQMTISYTQERDGYVSINAYPYYPNYVDPEYPDEPPYPYVDHEKPITIYAGPLETIGSKTLIWYGMDSDKNILAEGKYMLEVMLYSDPFYQTPPPFGGASENKPFSILYHLNQ